jgi:beta-glucanase (GH16 family)
MASSPHPVPRSRLRSRPILAAVAATVLVAAWLTAVIDARAAVPPPPTGWTQVFADDFTGGANTLPSTTNWRFSLGHGYPGGPANWGTGEIAAHTSNPANVSLDGTGNLRITPRRDGAGNWTSARIETNKQDFKAPAGGIMRVEARIQMPNVTGAAALGYWPAFWMLGTPYRGNWWNWPGIGEFDIMENVNGINSVWAVLHCGVAPGGPCNEFNGIGASRPCPGTSCQAGFHTYRFEWDRAVAPNQLRWYVDGQLFHSVSQSQLPADTWNSMTSHVGYFIILNVAIGGAFPDALAGRTPTAATVPGHPMVVDYVAAWTRSGGGPDPTPTGPSPTASPTSQPGSRDAYSTIQAESANQQNGLTIQTATDTGGGQSLAGAANGDWALYRGVNFGSTAARQFIARVASGAAGGVSGLVEVRLGSPTSAPVGSFAVANTGGWQSWRTIPANISGITGTHDVYVTFTSGQPADFVNVNWFTFTH